MSEPMLETVPLTPATAKELMGWETEKQYVARKMKEYPESKPETWLFGETGPRRDDNGQYQPVHCTDVSGQKVVCWHNGSNRPFDKGWCQQIIHMVLYGQWAGPLTCPGETVNGEAECTLRAAIEEANESPLPDMIHFDIPDVLASRRF